MPKGLTEVHDVGFVDVDDELEGVAHDEDEDDADQHGGHRQVPEIPTVSLLYAVQIFKKILDPCLHVLNLKHTNNAFQVNLHNRIDRYAALENLTL
jgi:hypothetical protein